MKAKSNRASQHAFTFWELLGVIAVISVLVMLAWTHVNRPRRIGHPPRCDSNLKQVALSFKMYAADHDQKFPMADGGAKDFVQPAVWKYFLALSNELGNPTVLICPQDVARVSARAREFSSSPTGLAHTERQNASISYFIGVSAEETKPNMVLTGDRNLAAGVRSAFYSSTNGNPVEASIQSTWRTSPQQPFHGDANHYALADGSVQQASTERLREALKLARDSYGTNANRFLFPQ